MVELDAAADALYSLSESSEDSAARSASMPEAAPGQATPMAGDPYAAMDQRAAIAAYGSPAIGAAEEEAAVARQASGQIAAAVAALHSVVTPGVARHAAKHTLNFVPGEWFVESNRRLIASGGAAPLDESMARKFSAKRVKLPELAGGFGEWLVAYLANLQLVQIG